MREAARRVRPYFQGRGHRRAVGRIVYCDANAERSSKRTSLSAQFVVYCQHSPRQANLCTEGGGFMQTKQDVEAVITQLGVGIASLFPRDKIEAILFGSYTRDDADADSDIPQFP